MSEPQRDENASAPAVRKIKREIRYDALAAVIAALVGLLALLVAGYTAYIQREQVRAQVWPYLEIGESDSLPTDHPENGSFVSHGGVLVAINKGVGPAIISRVVVLVNERPQPDWRHVFNALGLNWNAVRIESSSFDHVVLSPGETENFLMVLGNSDWGKFKTLFLKEGAIKVCYRSTLGEYWISTLDFRRHDRRSRPVRSCAFMPKADEFQQ